MRKPIQPETVSSKSESIGSPNGQTAKAAVKGLGTTRKRDKHARFSCTTDLEEAKLILADWVLKNETMVDEDPAVVPLATV